MNRRTHFSACAINLPWSSSRSWVFSSLRRISTRPAHPTTRVSLQDAADPPELCKIHHPAQDALEPLTLWASHVGHAEVVDAADSSEGGSARVVSALYQTDEDRCDLQVSKIHRERQPVRVEVLTRISMRISSFVSRFCIPHPVSD